MKKTIILLASIITLPAYSGAYAIANIFKMKDRQDMPTIYEWLNLYREVEEEEE